MTELPPICGIYKITSPTGKVYIGQSTNIEARWERYKKARCEQQRKLFHSLVKYGWINHIFEIIEECPIEDLKCHERYWQDYYEVGDRDKGLNCLLTECGELKEVILKLKRASPRKGKKEKVIKEPNEFKKFLNKTYYSKSKLVLDTQTGIFYYCAREVCELYGFKYETFKSRLNGKLKNNTQFIYA